MQCFPVLKVFPPLQPGPNPPLVTPVLSCPAAAVCCARQALIVDEAHRLKNSKSATRLALQELSVRWLLMLSGTPVQNNMKELQVRTTRA